MKLIILTLNLHKNRFSGLHNFPPAPPEREVHNLDTLTKDHTGNVMSTGANVIPYSRIEKLSRGTYLYCPYVGQPLLLPFPLRPYPRSSFIPILQNCYLKTVYQHNKCLQM